jgi:hypothetical protein
MNCATCGKPAEVTIAGECIPCINERNYRNRDRNDEPRPAEDPALVAAERADWHYRQELREWDRMSDLHGVIGGGNQSYISVGY